MTLLVLILILILAAPGLARAHALEAAGFAAGLAHPLGGFDHLLAMFAVGMASTKSGRAFIWATPGAFLAGMAWGYAADVSTLGAGWTESGVLVSLVALGLFVALPIKKNSAALAVLLVVAAFGWCHGHAHALDSVRHGASWPFALGFLGTSAGLHLLGVVTGLIYLEDLRSGRLFAASGAIIAAAGGGFAMQTHIWL